MGGPWIEGDHAGNEDLKADVARLDWLLFPRDCPSGRHNYISRARLIGSPMGSLYYIHTQHLHHTCTLNTRNFPNKCLSALKTKIQFSHPGLFVHLALEVAEGPADFCHTLSLSITPQRAGLLL